MKPWHGMSFWVTVIAAGFVALLIGLSLALKPDARVFPLAIAIPTVVCLLLAVAGEFSPRLASVFEVTWEGAAADDDEAQLAAAASAAERRGVAVRDIPWRIVGIVFGSVTIYAIAALLIGFTLASPLFILLFLRLYGGARWLGSIGVAAGTTVGIVGLSQLLNANLYPGLLFGGGLPPF